MTLLCKSCRRLSGTHHMHGSTTEEGFLEMEFMGKRKHKGKKYHVYQCARCDDIRVKIKNKNGLTTTKTMSVSEVEDLPSGSGLLTAIVAAGVLVVGATVVASASD